MAAIPPPPPPICPPPALSSSAISVAVPLRVAATCSFAAPPQSIFGPIVFLVVGLASIVASMSEGRPAWLWYVPRGRNFCSAMSYVQSGVPLVCFAAFS